MIEKNQDYIVDIVDMNEEYKKINEQAVMWYAEVILRKPGISSAFLVGARPLVRRINNENSNCTCKWFSCWRTRTLQ